MDELNRTPTPLSAAAWDGGTLALKRDHAMTLAAPEEGETPFDLLSGDGGVPGRIYWPLEQLLARRFSLPLAEPRQLDAAILSQELAELTGEEDEDWWLTWHAGKDESGVAGLVFGLPQAVRREMQEREAWQNCPQLLVDGWERLQAVRGGEESCAVIDEDADGVFFGVVRDGIWRGIRRLNRRSGLSGESGALLDDDELAEQIFRSWKAMGLDAEAGRVMGRTGSGLAAAMQSQYGFWEVEQSDKLPGRLQANLDLVDLSDSALNFRREKWAVRKQWPGLKRWRRPFAMAAGLLLVWIVATAVQLFMLDHQAAEYQARIEAAFHKGLPNEAVMLDPMAQLRRAAGGSSGEKGSYDLLRQLQLLGSTWREISWQISEISFNGGGVQMSGTASDIDSLNKIRDLLGKESGRDVVISDTDLSAGKVSFRMKW